MPVISFDTGAFNARLAEFKSAAQKNSGGHAVQKMASKGVDVSAINATMQKYVAGVQKFKDAMASMQIQDPSGSYRQLQSDLQSAVSSFQSQPKVASAAQSNLLSRSKVGMML